MAKKTNYTKNGNEYYRVTVTIGRDSNGKLIRKEFYGKSKKEAEAKRDEYLNGIKSGLNIDFQNATLGPLMKTWLFEVVRVSNRIKPSTFERYEGIYRNYIENSQIYGLRLSAIKSIQLQRYYNELYESGKTSSQIKNLNKLLKKFFFYAVEEGYILKNPCSSKSLVIPGEVEQEETEIEIFKDDEIEAIKKALEGHRLKALILLALGTGLRQGELLGLKWDHVDLENKKIKVEQAIKTVTIIDANGNRKLETREQPLKTKNSARTVPIPSSLIPVLKKHESNQKEEKLKAGPLYNDNGYVFATATGNPIDARNLLRAYERLLKKAGVPYRKFHALRHTYATKLFQRGVPLKTVQMLLGHSDISVTANIYVHVMQEQKIDAAEEISDLFN
ncbi:tyrosine-type recombinase/integrase [Caldanaerobius polysaccharolyticus]|uniref:tyrosine-type recombinase/integrase n=1 Tax=Caldanaerobius polysaccharolyticus TaxID=44256 RepID=UPI000478829A|nr:site-specific integrase [Caldanaerobius polysaccharolyticus]